MPPPRNLTIIPGLPPKPINTLMYATAGLMLSFVATGIYCAAQFFRWLSDGAHLTENLYCLMSFVPIAVLSFLFELKAINNETQRKHFQETVWEYTRKTGDVRYMPYILPVHIKLVTAIFVTSIALPIVGTMVSVYVLNLGMGLL